MKECAYCGEEFTGKGVVVGGETFCSKDCAEAHAEEDDFLDEDEDEFEDMDDE